MGRNIFISYKYGDTKVPDLSKKETIDFYGSPVSISRQTRVRDYVDELQGILDAADNINLGEKDGESLEEFADSQIATSLKNKIFRSSITIVMVSKGMKDYTKTERNQWIPWEISYSLREVTRADKISRANAVLVVVLPDEFNSYSWYLTYDSECNCTNHNTSLLFKIIRANMFNEKKPSRNICNGYYVYSGEYSYIKNVKWGDFIKNPNYYIEQSILIRDKKDNYNVTVNLD